MGVVSMRYEEMINAINYVVNGRLKTKFPGMVFKVAHSNVFARWLWCKFEIPVLESDSFQRDYPRLFNAFTRKDDLYVFVYTWYDDFNLPTGWDVADSIFNDFVKIATDFNLDVY